MPRKGRKGSFEWFEEQVDVEPIPNHGDPRARGCNPEAGQAGGDNAGSIIVLSCTYVL